MTRDELKRMFPNASEAFLAENADRGAPSHAQPQPVVRHEPMAAPAVEAVYPGRVLVRITGFTTRPCDPDNCTGKFHTDCLRYAGIIKNDRPQDIDLETRQVKVSTKADERVEIEIIPYA
jgi:hypothetical protein